MSFGPGFALAVIAALGAGEAADVTRSWEAPLSCPSQAWLDARVDAYLGDARDRDAELAFVGVVLAVDARFELVLVTEIFGVRERHEIAHHDCAALTEIAASLLAIAIDPLAVGPEPMIPAADPREVPSSFVPIQRPHARAAATTAVARSEPEPEPEPSPPTPADAEPQPGADDLLALDSWADDATDDEPDRPRPRSRPRSGVRLVVGADGGLALGLFPNPAPTVHGALGLVLGPRARRTAARVELAGGASLLGRFRSEDRSSGGDMIAWDLAARACAVPRWGRFELRGCAAIGAGQIRAQGIGVDEVLARAHPWVWLSAELGLAVELRERVALFAQLGPAVNLARPNFSVTSPSASYVTPIVSGLGRAGLELRFL